MNMIPENDRKLLETLKSLSLEPSLQKQESPDKRSRRLSYGACFIALLISAVGAGTFIWPDDINRFKEGLSQQWLSQKSEPILAVEAARNDASSSIPVKPSPVAAREITGSGYVVASSAVSVYSKYEGQIRSVSVEIGQRVEAGQALIVLDDSTSHLELEQAQSDKISARLTLEAKRIELDQAEANFLRSETLADKQAVSKEDLLQASTTYNSANNALAQAQQSLAKADLDVKIAQDKVDDFVLRAPISGTITELNAHTGDMVLARSDSVRENQKLLAITDTTTLVIDADVAETNIGVIDIGLAGEAVLDGLPDRPFAVQIQRIAPVVSLEKGTVTLRLKLRDPPGGIRPNMAARIRLAQSAGEKSQ
ncbi:efflux RND transporter periplasmic adaptor subunit [Agrobacterium vitis]|nr:efflux RND transporter periplasmic adaptor subunit [Agrobacterium vitis]MUO73401.1 efflux RND transporter periplasmic adaptor subunit [Agrobacterium vitis]MUO87620.1 efflux RND transporter periplasmic adaptor subunit [Agrobacterium vitis]MVA38120.1 efflux RND transporter periplasmic adaptor subunit [Agrobacterium vitis]